MGQQDSAPRDCTERSWSTVRLRPHPAARARSFRRATTFRGTPSIIGFN